MNSQFKFASSASPSNQGGESGKGISIDHNEV